MKLKDRVRRLEAAILPEPEPEVAGACAIEHDGWYRDPYRRAKVKEAQNDEEKAAWERMPEGDLLAAALRDHAEGLPWRLTAALLRFLSDSGVERLEIVHPNGSATEIGPESDWVDWCGRLCEDLVDDGDPHGLAPFRQTFERANLWGQAVESLPELREALEDLRTVDWRARWRRHQGPEHTARYWVRHRVNYFPLAQRWPPEVAALFGWECDEAASAG